MRLRVYSERSDFGRNDRLAILAELEDGSIAVAQPLQFMRHNPGQMPEFTVDQSAVSGYDARAVLQAFLDHAWEIGMRPSGFADTTEQVGAIKAHLADMRALVFTGRGVEPKA